MLRTNATISDWDGHITVLNREDVEVLCNRNKENNKNFESDNRKEKINVCTTNKTDQNNCGTSISSFNHSVIGDKCLDKINCNSEADKNESQDETSRHSSVILGSFYHQIVTSSSQLGESATEVMVKFWC